MKPEILARRRRSGARAAALLAAFAAVLAMGAGPALAGSYHDIYEFQGGTDGVSPNGGLVMDAQGRLYGVTSQGGTYGYGTVFRLTPPASGQGTWSNETLHSFTYQIGGYFPSGSLVLGPDGSIYGTTNAGSSLRGQGTVFKLTNAPGWPETLLHNFGNGQGGIGPRTGVLFGPGGLLYGVTYGYGTATLAEMGTVYSLSPQGSRVEYKVLHSFGHETDGIEPTELTPVTFVNFNGFFGTTHSSDGGYGYGTVFSEQIFPNGQGAQAVVHAFGRSSDVGVPISSPTLGTGAIKGVFYGCGTLGGTHGIGGVYTLTPSAGHGFTEAVIYNFGDQSDDPQDGAEIGNLKLVQADYSGTLVGTSGIGGLYGDGAFFELDPPAVAGGTWTEKVDVSFNTDAVLGGGSPSGAPLKVGRVYYGTLGSKQGGYGAIYEVTQ